MSWRIGQGRTDDNIAAALRQARDTYAYPFGKPVGPVSGIHRASYGQYVRCNTFGGDVDVVLPPNASPGQPITVSNEGYNTVYVHPPPRGVIGKFNTPWPISRTTPPITFINISAGVFDCPGAPTERIWAEWNEIDLTQFEFSTANSNCTASSGTVAIGSGNQRRPTITMTVTGNSAANVPQSCGLMLLKRRPPTVAYRVEAFWEPTTASGVTCDGGPVARFNGTDTFFVNLGLINSDAFSAYKGDSATALISVTPGSTEYNMTTGQGMWGAIEVRASAYVEISGGGMTVGIAQSGHSDSVGQPGFAVRGHNGSPAVKIRKWKCVLTNTYADRVP